MILTNLEYASTPSTPPVLASKEAIRRLEAAALAHNSEAFIRELEAALSISHAQAHRVAHDELGEPLVVAAKAARRGARGAAAVAAVRESGDRTVGAARLRSRDLYDEISVDAARHLLMIWRESDPPLPRRNRDPDAVARDARWAHGNRGTRHTAVRRAEPRGEVGARLNRYQLHDVSRKCRPARSSTSTIQVSGSKRISRVSRSSILSSGTGCSPTDERMRDRWGGLRRTHSAAPGEQYGGAVEPVQLDEDRARHLPHRGCAPPRTRLRCDSDGYRRRPRSRTSIA